MLVPTGADPPRTHTTAGVLQRDHGPSSDGSVVTPQGAKPPAQCPQEHAQADTTCCWGHIRGTPDSCWPQTALICLAVSPQLTGAAGSL